MCDSAVAGCQSQHQYHFWRMSSMFEAYCTVSLAAVNQTPVIHKAMNGCKNLKIQGLLGKCKYCVGMDLPGLNQYKERIKVSC